MIVFFFFGKRQRNPLKNKTNTPRLHESLLDYYISFFINVPTAIIQNKIFEITIKPPNIHPKIYNIFWHCHLHLHCMVLRVNSDVKLKASHLNSLQNCIVNSLIFYNQNRIISQLLAISCQDSGLDVSYNVFYISRLNIVPSRYVCVDFNPPFIMRNQAC